jgi:hypothetical protein
LQIFAFQQILASVQPGRILRRKVVRGRHAAVASPGQRAGEGSCSGFGCMTSIISLVLLVIVPVSIGFAWRRADEK